MKDLYKQILTKGDKRLYGRDCCYVCQLHANLINLTLLYKDLGNSRLRQILKENLANIYIYIYMYVWCSWG